METSVSASKISYPGEMLRQLPVIRKYLRCLGSKQRLFVSAEHLAADLKIDTNELLGYIAIVGIPCNSNTNFAVNPLADAIEIFLGYHRENMAFMIGSGILAGMVLRRLSSDECGLKVVAVFDDPKPADTAYSSIKNIDVFPPEKISDLSGRMHITTGIIATADEKAQEAASLFERSGITRIWNLTAIPVKTSDNIIVENSNMAYDLGRFMKRLKETK